MRERSTDSDIGVPLLRQRWRAVSFVHWRCDPADIAGRLPAGLAVDEYDGTAWLSILAFEMVDVRPTGLPALGSWSTFPETNLRSYVRGPDGRPGIWFFSLDAESRWLTSLTPRLLGIPYCFAHLSIEESDGIRYRGRRADGRADYDIVIQPGARLEPSERDVWLTDRRRAYSRRAGRLLEVPVRHASWPLQDARCRRLDETLTAAAGLPSVSEDVVVHFSAELRDVAFGLVRLPR